MKRIAAIVLPKIACELALLQGLVDSSQPFAVIVDDEAAGQASSIDKGAILDAVSHQAWTYGARPGQSAAQAAAFVGKLRVVHLERAELETALGAVAEVALGFGTTAAISLHRDETRLGHDTLHSHYPLGAAAGPLDTVWLDVSGCARLLGGEEVLAAELRERVGLLGHRARIAIGDGPRLAQAIARWAPPRPSGAELILPAGSADPSGGAVDELAQLPIAALPLPGEMARWLIKLGVLRIEDLQRLDRAALAHRLGPSARDLLELVAGRDDVPLCPYQPPRRIVESTSFEDEIGSTEPLLFVLRGLTSRALSRLTARGEACTRASIVLGFDRSVIALLNRSRGEQQNLDGEMQLDLDLPLALSGQDELLRALRALLENLELRAPVTSLALILDGLTARPQQQIDLGRRRGTDPNALPTLLAELDAWLGPGRVGTLTLVDSHRPEAQSALVRCNLQASSDLRTRKTSADSATHDPLAPDPLASILLSEPTRVLPEPIFIGKLSAGGLVNASNTLYLVDRLRLSARIDNVEWWSASPVSRDYARAWLRTNVRQTRHGAARIVDEHAEHAEAWMFVDRTSGRGFLHGWFE